MNFPTTKKLKALKYKFCFSFYACQKKVVEFTESAPTIYFRKQQAVEKSLSIYVFTIYLPI